MTWATYFFLSTSAILIIIIALFLLFYLHKRNLQNFWTAKRIPFFPLPLNICQRVLHKTNLIEMDGWIYTECKQNGHSFIGSSDEFDFGPILFIKDLALVKQVCVKDFDTFVNRRSVKNLESLPTMNIFSQILFFQQDQKWRDLRSRMTPTFTTGKIRRMFHIFNSSSVKLVQQLRNEIRTGNGGVLNLEAACAKYTIDVIASAAFGLETSVFENPSSLFLTMAQKLQALTIFNLSIIFKFLLIVLFPFLATRAKFIYEDSQRVKNYFAKLITDTISQRRRNKNNVPMREDFLQVMVNTQSEAVAPSMQISDELIISQCMQFFIAGLDTTQSGLEFIPYLLALNPDCQEKLFTQLKKAVDENAGQLNYEVVTQCEYLDQVVNECLRLFPPAQRTERVSVQDYQLPGTEFKIPRGTTVIIPMYHIHHDPTHFPSPEKFDPERFSPTVKAQRNPYAYFPFGIGPRNCIANRFVLIELKTAVAHLVLNFKFQPCPQTTIPMEFKVSTSLKPTRGIWLKVQERI